MKTLGTTFLLLFIFCLSNLSQAQNTSGQLRTLIENLNSANSKEVYRSIEQLKKFSYADFSINDKKRIAEELKEDHAHLDRLIELCGFLQLESELFAYAQNNKVNKRIKQTLNLALVRAGNENKLNNLIKNLSSIPVSDDYAYNLVPKLAQTSQKAVFDYLLTQVLDENISCKHPDMETKGLYDCAHPIIEHIAPYINDFPFDVNQYGIVSNNPDEVLEVTRKWINKNKNTYSINKEIF